jgi:hypothetical protein
MLDHRLFPSALRARVGPNHTWAEARYRVAELRKDTPEQIARVLVENVAPSRAEKIAAAIDEKVYGDDQDEDENEHIRDAVIYYLGDRDRSGLKIDESIEVGIRRILTNEFDWNDGCQTALTFQRIAVTPEQITAWNLPTRPSSVELDAIRAPDLRALVRDHIERHVDQGHLYRLRQIEQEEREQLLLFAKQIKPGV